MPCGFTYWIDKYSADFPGACVTSSGKVPFVFVELGARPFLGCWDPSAPWTGHLLLGTWCVLLRECALPPLCLHREAVLQSGRRF